MFDLGILEMNYENKMPEIHKEPKNITSAVVLSKEVIFLKIF